MNSVFKGNYWATIGKHHPMRAHRIDLSQTMPRKIQVDAAGDVLADLRARPRRLLDLPLTHIKVKHQPRRRLMAAWAIGTGGDRQMGTQSDMHFFVNWAKERLDEMDAALVSLEARMVGGIHADAREKASEVLAELRKSRDGFHDTVKKQAGANEAAWNSAKSRLETEWSGFEADVKKYIESFGKQLEQQQATFKVQADAQLKAWREAADKFGSAAGEFASERRSEIDAAVKRMTADAVAAEKKLQDLAQAGTQSWAALTTALTETRNVFDRANQAVREAFKRAA